MPDAARIAQAQALEVPIILQGVKAGGESGKSELFSENATTVLVFENGAALNLRSRLSVGQSVFLHNTQNGKEVLCKVLEAPPEGETGYTDLEFTNAIANFWDADSQSDTQAVQEDAQPQSHVPTGSPADDPLAMMLQTASKIDVPSMSKPGGEPAAAMREELMAAHEMAPDPAAAPVPAPDFEAAATTERPSPAAAPSGEQIDAALKQMSGAAQAAAAEGSEAANPDEEKHIAALMARDARLAKFAAFKEKQAEKLQRDATEKQSAKGEDKPGKESESSKEAAAPKSLPMQMSLVEQLTSGKNATYLTIGVGVLILVAVGLIWHAMSSSFTQPARPRATSAPVATTAPEPAATSPAMPAASAPGAPATASAAAVEPKSTPRSVEPKLRRETGATDGAETRNRRPSASGDDGIEPAIVLSQPQPTLPPWAKDMEVDGVVKIDALIDEKGNVADTRVLSGPRGLQREAERALGLWVFEPARQNGKAIPSHLTLSVEFLPPPPPKRFP
jgi:outer membrane biosynthesis protein TonB